ncbi:MAG: AMP-binding protein, partial [Psychrosphaera sp.]|nr:AMP-binding protein [Psychrosphaera sp.]
GALAYGGRLIVIPSWKPRSVEDFYQLLIDEKVTVLNQTPTAFNQLSSIDAQRRERLSLRVVVFGGEALNLQELGSWVDRHGDDSPQLVNMYGITETTVHVTYRRILAEDIAANQGSLIGRPIGDLSLYILSDTLCPVPVGVCGEMYVGGAGVTRGYLNQPELTASRFIENPFVKGNVVEAKAERLYRTGDLARFLPGGEIDYLGRIDHQVKIRGFRIELGEIEQQLSQLPQVKASVVLAREDEPGQKRLVAYVVSEPDEANNDLVNTLRTSLKAVLLEHMVPSFFVIMDELPLTANGKVDTKVLLSQPMSLDAALLSSDYVAPASLTENILVGIWAGLLKTDVDKLGVTSNFFEMGGDSILSIQVVSRAAQQDMNITVKQLFEHQTIRELARGAEDNERIEAPQQPMTGRLDLLPIHHHFFEDEIDLHHFNQSVLLVTPATFEAAY